METEVVAMRMERRFLYEFHDFRFDSLDLPPLPADRSDFDVHGALKTHQVQTLIIF
jgi:hypothetical protein